MTIRDIRALRDQQAALLAEYEQSQATGERPDVDSGRSGVPPVVWARVTDVVVSDATYGPHLVAIRQVPGGTPPVWADAGSSTVRCYPGPSDTVGEFGTGDRVRLAVCQSVVIATKS